MAVLEYFTPENPKRSMSELHRLMKLPKTNIFRMLFTLESLGYLEKEPETSRYYISLRMYELGCRALVALDFRALSNRYVKMLHDRTGETVMLSVLDGREIVHIDVIQSQQRLRASSQIGARLPAYATSSGLALLAFSTDHAVENVLSQPLAAVTESTMTDPDVIRSELKEIRQVGFSTNRGGRLAEIFGIAAPILGRSGYAEAAIAISTPLAYINDKSLGEFQQAILEVAGQFSRTLGYRPPVADSLPTDY